MTMSSKQLTKPLRVDQLLDWLKDNGPATAKRMRLAGFDAVWNGDTKKRLLESGAVVAIHLPNVNRRVFTYKKPYVRRVGGTPKGFKHSPDKSLQAHIQGAITLLTKHGYTVMKNENIV